jgi:uncharacterized protein YcgI (DUF1989 family)
MFENTYDATKPHPNWFDNLSNSIAPVGILPEQIYVLFNIFMNAGINQYEEMTIHPPLSNPGDFINGVW